MSTVIWRTKAEYEAYVAAKGGPEISPDPPRCDRCGARDWDVDYLEEGDGELWPMVCSDCGDDNPEAVLEAIRKLRAKG